MADKLMLYRALTVTISFAAAFNAPPAYAQDQAATWSMAAPLPIARSEMKAATVDGKIYLIGGAWDEDPVLNEGTHYDAGFTTEYDPQSDSWRELTRAPEGLTHQALAVLDGKIYVAGGFAGTRHTLSSAGVYAYDIASDQWQALAPFSQAQGGGVLAAVDGKIHVIGGRLGPNPSNVGLHDIYDPQSDSWESAPPMPTGRSSTASAQYRGMLFIAGGECREEGGTYGEVEAYDPRSESWLTFPALPVPRHAFAAAAADNKLFFFGGSTHCGGAGKGDDTLVFELP